MSGTATKIMTHKVISVQPGDSVSTVAATLVAHGISAVPVVDEAGKLLGMVSEGDLAPKIRPAALVGSKCSRKAKVSHRNF